MNIFNEFNSIIFDSTLSTQSVALMERKEIINKLSISHDEKDKVNTLKALDVNKINKSTSESLDQLHKVDPHSLYGMSPADNRAFSNISSNNQSTLSPRNEPSQKLISKINRIFWVGLGCWTTYNLMDAGLARFFALETLTHGTGPLGYIGINLNGADPNFGGGETGSSIVNGKEEYIKNSKNFFHLFKDSGFPERCAFGNQPFICTWLGNKILPRAHAVFSGIANFGYSTDGSKNPLKMALGRISGFLTPTLKFRFIPEEISNCTDSCRFEIDPDYAHSALRTSKPISPNHLGIIGSLSQGINTDMFNRMYADPGKVLFGIALLVTAALVAKKTYQYYLNSASEGQLNALEKPETQDKSSEKKVSFFQNFRKKIKPIAVNSCWATLALTTIFLNTI